MAVLQRDRARSAVEGHGFSRELPCAARSGTRQEALRDQNLTGDGAWPARPFITGRRA
jgi:hypothetical protein